MGCLGTDGVWGTVKVNFDFGRIVREKQRRVGFYRKEQGKDQLGAGPYRHIRRNNKPTRTAGEQQMREEAQDKDPRGRQRK